jgi:hypothetical protein
MQVKLCARCPYAPDDLATHYEPNAALHLCANCDREAGSSTSTTHAKPEGDKNAQQLPKSSVRQSEPLRAL